IRPWGSKCLINACMDYRYIKSFSPRTKLSKEVYENVVTRWQELGLSGTPPAISVFEDETRPPAVTSGKPQGHPLNRHPEVPGAKRRASKGDGPTRSARTLWPPSFEARALLSAVHVCTSGERAGTSG